MIHELRVYDLRPGTGPEYLSLFLQHGLGAVTRHLPLAGYWLTESGTLNRLYHLWIYTDLAERDAARAGLAEDQAWNERFVPRGFPLIQRQHNMFMELISGSDDIRRAEAGRRRHHPDRAAGASIFADSVQSLTAGAFGSDAAIARWRVLSGDEPGRELALWNGAGLELAASYQRHEVLRPVTCSPLQ